MGRACRCCDDDTCRFVGDKFNLDRYAPSVKSIKRVVTETYHVIYKGTNRNQLVSKEKVSTEEKFSTSSSRASARVCNFAYTSYSFDDYEYIDINNETHRKETHYKYIVQERVILEYKHEDVLLWDEDLYLGIALRLGNSINPTIEELDPEGRTDKDLIGRSFDKSSDISGFITQESLFINNFNQWDDQFSGADFQEYLEDDDYDVVDIKDFHSKENSIFTFLLQPAYTGDDFLDDFLDDAEEERDGYGVSLGRYYNGLRVLSDRYLWLEIVRPPFKEVSDVDNYLSLQRSVSHIELDWHERWQRKTMWNFVSTVDFSGTKNDFFEILNGSTVDFFTAEDKILNLRFFKPKTNNTKEGAEVTYADTSFYKETMKDWFFYANFERECGQDFPGLESFVGGGTGDSGELEKTLSQPEVMIGGYHYNDYAPGLFGLFKQTQIEYGQTNVPVGLYRSDFNYTHRFRMNNKTEGVVHTLRPQSFTTGDQIYIKDCVIQFPASDEIPDEIYDKWTVPDIILGSASVDVVYPRGFYGINSFFPSSQDNFITDRIYPDIIPVFRERTNFFTETQNCHIEFSLDGTRGFISDVVSFDDIDRVQCEDICGLFELDIKNQRHYNLNIKDLGSISNRCGRTTFTSRRYNCNYFLDGFSEVYEAWVVYRPVTEILFYTIGGTDPFCGVGADGRFCFNPIRYRICEPRIFNDDVTVYFDFTDSTNCGYGVFTGNVFNAGNAFGLQGSPNVAYDPYRRYDARISFPMSSMAASFLPTGASLGLSKSGFSDVVGDADEGLSDDGRDKVSLTNSRPSDIETGWTKTASIKEATCISVPSLDFTEYNSHREMSSSFSSLYSIGDSSSFYLFSDDQGNKIRHHAVATCSGQNSDVVLAGWDLFTSQYNIIYDVSSNILCNHVLLDDEGIEQSCERFAGAATRGDVFYGPLGAGLRFRTKTLRTPVEGPVDEDFSDYTVSAFRASQPYYVSGAYYKAEYSSDSFDTIGQEFVPVYSRLLTDGEQSFIHTNYLSGRFDYHYQCAGRYFFEDPEGQDEQDGVSGNFVWNPYFKIDPNGAVYGPFESTDFSYGHFGYFMEVDTNFRGGFATPDPITSFLVPDDPLLVTGGNGTFFTSWFPLEDTAYVDGYQASAVEDAESTIGGIDEFDDEYTGRYFVNASYSDCSNATDIGFGGADGFGCDVIYYPGWETPIIVTSQTQTINIPEPPYEFPECCFGPGAGQLVPPPATEECEESGRTVRPQGILTTYGFNVSGEDSSIYTPYIDNFEVIGLCNGASIDVTTYINELPSEGDRSYQKDDGDSYSIAFTSINAYRAEAGRVTLMHRKFMGEDFVPSSDLSAVNACNSVPEMNFDVNDGIFYDLKEGSTDKIQAVGDASTILPYYGIVDFTAIADKGIRPDGTYRNAPGLSTGIGHAVFAEVDLNAAGESGFILDVYNRDDLVAYLEATYGDLDEFGAQNALFLYDNTGKFIAPSDFQAMVEKWQYENWQPGTIVSGGFNKRDFVGDIRLGQGPLSDVYGFNHDVWGRDIVAGSVEEDVKRFVQDMRRNNDSVCDGGALGIGQSRAVLAYRGIINFYDGYFFTIVEKERT